MTIDDWRVSQMLSLSDHQIIHYRIKESRTVNNARMQRKVYRFKGREEENFKEIIRAESTRLTGMNIEHITEVEQICRRLNTPRREGRRRRGIGGMTR